MSEIKTGFRKVLSNPIIYSMLQELLGGANFKKTIVSKYIQPSSDMSLLDVGCGPAEILAYLPENIDYIGFDMSQKYIDQALKLYGDRGRFFQGSVNNASLNNLDMVDMVITIGVLHHLEDEEVMQLSTLVQKALKPGGRFLSIDPCFFDEQPWIARYLICKDRGQNVRPMDDYKTLIEKGGKWEMSSCHIRQDLLRLPYTHAIVECRK